MSSDYIEKLQGESLARYKSKLQLCGLVECPYQLPANTWKIDPTAWPPVDFGSIYIYLIESPGVHTREAMRNYKGLASYRLLQSGWVCAVKHMKPADTSITVFRAEVTPSFKVNDPPHNPWAAVSDSGNVITAHCDCKAGLGESCSHIGGLLYKIEMVVRTGGTRKPTCTDVLCTWNEAHMKGVKPAPISEIQFYSDKAKEKLKKGRPRRAEPQPMNEGEKQAFLQSLLENSSPANMPIVLSLFSATAAHFVPKKTAAPRRKLPAGLRSLYNGQTDNMATRCKEVIENLRITKLESEYVQECSRLQSESLVWYEQRAGRITSSVIHEVLHTNPQRPASSLIIRICDDKPKKLNVPAIKWGKDHENIARQQYIDGIVSSGHINVRVKEVGLIISNDRPYLAASPDGTVTCDCHGSGVLEIKCPYSYRERTLEEMVLDPVSSIDRDFQLKKTHKYYAQVQLQMYVTGASFCDFLVWLPHGGRVCTISRDESFLMENLPKLEEFWQNHILPELLVRSTEKKSTTTTTASSSNTYHCSCGTIDKIPMIGCDDVSCPNQWYHWECVGLKKEPRSKRWYCDLCRPNNTENVKKKRKH